MDPEILLQKAVVDHATATALIDTTRMEPAFPNLINGLGNGGNEENEEQIIDVVDKQEKSAIAED